MLLPLTVKTKLFITWYFPLSNNPLKINSAILTPVCGDGNLSAMQLVVCDVCLNQV